MKTSEIDPFYVASLIALAQNCRSSRLQNGDNSEIVQVSGQLTNLNFFWFQSSWQQVYLFTPSNDRKSLSLYSAAVSVCYLQKFDSPYQFSHSCLNITQRDLSLERVDEIVNTLRHILQIDQTGPAASTRLSTKRKALFDLTNRAASNIGSSKEIMGNGKRAKLDTWTPWPLWSSLNWWKIHMKLLGICHHHIESSPPNRPASHLRPGQMALIAWHPLGCR